jgi:hypothetical protein
MSNRANQSKKKAVEEAKEIKEEEEEEKDEENNSSAYQTRFKLANTEILIADFNCALEKKILLQGKLYISKNFVCFYANIFGSETNLVIPSSDITGIQKINTAIIIPNAIKIFTTYNTYIFRSFLSRDKAFQLVNQIKPKDEGTANDEKEPASLGKVKAQAKPKVQSSKESNSSSASHSEDDSDSEESNSESKNSEESDSSNDSSASEDISSAVPSAARIYQYPPLQNNRDPKLAEITVKLRGKPKGFDFEREGRRFINEGFLQRQGSWSVVDRWCFLFSDLFLFTKQLDKNGTQFKMKQIVPIKGLTIDCSPKALQKLSIKTKLNHIISLTSNTASKDKAEFISPNMHSSYIIGCESYAEKLQWSKLLNLAIARAYYGNKANNTREFGWQYKFCTGNIHNAVYNNDIPLIQAILAENKSAINELDESLLSVLHIAAHCDHAQLVPLLIKAGADAKLIDANGYTAIHTAACKGNVAVLQQLLELCNNSAQLWHPTGSKKQKKQLKSRSALWLVALIGNFNTSECIRLLLHYRGENHSEGKAILDDRDDDGKSLIEYCAINNLTEAIQAIITAGASIDIPNTAGKTPLTLAIQKANQEIVEILIKAGAQPNWRWPKTLETALHHCKSLEIAVFLVEHGARMNLKSSADKKAVDQFSSKSAQSQLAQAEQRFLAKGTTETEDLMKPQANSFKANNYHSLDCCALCQEDFTLTKKKDFCRHCALNICPGCCVKKLIFRRGSGKNKERILARVCTGCFNHVSYKDAGKFKTKKSAKIIEDNSSAAAEKKNHKANRKSVSRRWEEIESEEEEEAEKNSSGAEEDNSSEAELESDERGIGAGLAKGFKKGFKFAGSVAGAVAKGVSKAASQVGDAVTAVALPNNSQVIGANGHVIQTATGPMTTKEQLAYIDAGEEEEKPKKARKRKKKAEEEKATQLNNNKSSAKVMTSDEEEEEVKRPEKSLTNRVSSLFSRGTSIAKAGDVKGSLAASKRAAAVNLDKMREMENKSASLGEDAADFHSLAAKLKEKSKNRRR